MRRARCAVQHRLCVTRSSVTTLCWAMRQNRNNRACNRLLGDKRRRGTNGGVGRLSCAAIVLERFGFHVRDVECKPRAAHRREQANGESLVEEESTDEHVVERRKRRCWTRAKRRFGRGTQTTGCAYKTNRPILDWRLAVC